QKLDIELKAGEIVDLEKVWKLIARQGYRLRKENTHLVLRGRLERQDGSWSLTLSGIQSKTWPLEIAISPKEKQARNGSETGIQNRVPAPGDVEVEATVALKNKELRLIVHRIKLSTTPTVTESTNSAVHLPQTSIPQSDMN